MDMDKEQILALLHELGDELVKEHSIAVISVFGGSAIAIAYCDTRASNDIDIILNSGDWRIFYKITERMAKKYNLDEKWISEAIEEIVSVDMKNDFQLLNYGQFGGLIIRIASAEQLLAMKIFSARIEKDSDDAVMLANQINVKSKKGLLKILYKYFKPESINERNADGCISIMIDYIEGAVKL